MKMIPYDFVVSNLQKPSGPVLRSHRLFPESKTNSQHFHLIEHSHFLDCYHRYLSIQSAMVFVDYDSDCVPDSDCLHDSYVRLISCCPGGFLGDCPCYNRLAQHCLLYYCLSDFHVDCYYYDCLWRSLGRNRVENGDAFLLNCYSLVFNEEVKYV